MTSIQIRSFGPQLRFAEAHTDNHGKCIETKPLCCVELCSATECRVEPIQEATENSNCNWMGLHWRHSPLREELEWFCRMEDADLAASSTRLSVSVEQNANLSIPTHIGRLIQKYTRMTH
jgi:hypothetical protein